MNTKEEELAVLLAKKMAVDYAKGDFSRTHTSYLREICLDLLADRPRN